MAEGDVQILVTITDLSAVAAAVGTMIVGAIAVVSVAVAAVVAVAADAGIKRFQLLFLHLSYHLLVISTDLLLPSAVRIRNDSLTFEDKTQRS